jgi:uncharacterized protein with PQ loop repeat
MNLARLLLKRTKFSRITTLRGLSTSELHVKKDEKDETTSNLLHKRTSTDIPHSMWCAPFTSTAATLPFTSVATNTKAVSFSSLLATSAATTTLSPAAISFLQVFPPLAAQVVFFAPLQAMKQFKKDGTTGDVSPIPYTAMCVNGIVWMAYGALLNEPTIWAPNISAFFFGAYYVHTFNTYKANHVNMTPQYAAIALAAAATGGVCLGMPEQAGSIIGHVAIGIVAIMFGGPLASIKTVFKDKSTKSLPFAFTCATLVNCVAWSSYGYLVIDDYIVWLPNMLGLGAACAQLALFAKFGIHKDGDESEKKTD